MFICQKHQETINTEKIQDFRKQFMIQSKKHLIIFDMEFGLQFTWAYDTEEDRNKVFDKLNKLLKSETIE